MTPDLPAIIARLRRAQPRNLDTMEVCDALEAFLRAPKPKTYEAIQQDYNDALVRFDRLKYQRAYMRDKRAAKKLGISTAEYRKSNSPPA